MQGQNILVPSNELLSKCVPLLNKSTFHLVNSGKYCTDVSENLLILINPGMFKNWKNLYQT